MNSEQLNIMFEFSFLNIFVFKHYLHFFNFFFFFLMIRPPPSSPLFPYPTLFRSVVERVAPHPGRLVEGERAVGPGKARRRRHHERALAGVDVADVQRAARARIASSAIQDPAGLRSEEHTSELQSQSNLVCRLLLE